MVILLKTLVLAETTVSLDFDKPYINQTENQLAQNFLPNIVVIMLGTNDAFLSEEQRSNFTNNYKELVTEFRGLTSEPKIFAVTPPPAFNNTIGLPPDILKKI